jgi:hypothetical protein
LSFSDLLLLLRQDFRQTFRISGAKGKRTEKKSTIRRLFPLFAVIIGFALIMSIVFLIVSLIWNEIVGIIFEDPGLGATIFNAILVFTFVGSIMISANTVGNSDKMEYLLILPIPMRIVFLEKTIVIIIFNSLFLMILGMPIFAGLSLISSAPLAILSVPAFAGLLLILNTLAVSIGGILGLIFSRLLANRRTLKQIGWFLVTIVAVVLSTFWYINFYIGGNGGFEFIGAILQILEGLGFSSAYTPGYIISALTLGLVVGAPIDTGVIYSLVIFSLAAISLVFINAYACEYAHYSGWITSGAKRTPKIQALPDQRNWDPQSIPGMRFNTTISVSIWYNIVNIKREARVFAQYLVNPLRFAIWLIVPLFALGSTADFMAPYLLVAALIPFATSYGIYFAGYETVYEGKNLLNLQLAAANMEDYLKGKVYSAVPFTFGVAICISILTLFVAPEMASYLPVIILSAIFLNLASGGIAANAAATGGDFRSQRLIYRQRGSAAQMPVRGWAALKAQFIPNILGFVGFSLIIGIGLLFGILFSFVSTVLFAILCYHLFRRYTHSAGVRLAQIEASDYL